MPMQLAMNEVGPLDTSTIADILDAAEALNQKWVIIPWMSDAWRNAEGYAHLASYLKALSSALERGTTAKWHNHEFEFQPLEDGTVPYDYLIENLKGRRWCSKWTFTGWLLPEKILAACSRNTLVCFKARKRFYADTLDYVFQ